MRGRVGGRGRGAWRALGVLAALSLADEARALDPWMWGVGPRLGTNLVPLRTPVRLPPTVDDGVDAVTWDLALGVHGALQVAEHHRLNAYATLDLGRRFLDADLVVTWNHVTQLGDWQILPGVGAGFGTARWGRTDGARLRVAHLPLRAELGVAWTDRVRAVQLTPFTTWRLPTTGTTTAPDGRRAPAGWFWWGTFGLEVSVLFGDFTPGRVR